MESSWLFHSQAFDSLPRSAIDPTACHSIPMTSAGRFGSAARHTLPQSPYVCLQCRLRTSAATRTTNSSISITYAPRRHASWLNTDKLRKKIWAQANEGVKQLESAPEKKQESTPEEKYVPATTAKGLKWVGGHGWGDAEWQAENQFQGFGQFYCQHCNVY